MGTVKFSDDCHLVVDNRLLFWQLEMKVTFQKAAGDDALGVEFFWKMTVTSKAGVRVSDHFIPELFFDFFYVREGSVSYRWETRSYPLPPQSLKTIFNQPLTFEYSTPLVLYGARLSLKFAESFWEEMKANSFLEQAWAGKEPKSLNAFARQVRDHIRLNRWEKSPYPMFSKRLDESDWLVNFSPRHTRRLYAGVFGLSRQELMNIHNVQSFLEQTCNFAAQNPRILHHVDPGIFYDQPHLNRSFKKMTGLSPVEYFEAASILQDNLMSASYNAVSQV